MRQVRAGPRALAFLALAILAFLSGASGALLATCGPFTDVAADSFCPFVLEIFTLGITTGTTPTTYAPGNPVTRLQMAAFLSRTVDGVLKRGSRRAALDQFWTSRSATILGLTTVGPGPMTVQADGEDVWVGGGGTTYVSRVRASDGRVLETWTGLDLPRRIVLARGRVNVLGYQSLWELNPTLPPAPPTLTALLPVSEWDLTADGRRFWAAGGFSSVCIVTPTASLPWTVTIVTAGFSAPTGILFDGGNVWVIDYQLSGLLKLDAGGTILQTVTVGLHPWGGAFDGSNIWAINNGDSTVTVVRASTGAVLATLTGNGLSGPRMAAFDGERVLVTNQSGDSVSLWKAADLSPLGSVDTGSTSAPWGSCSDGIHFWVGLATAKLARF